MFNVATLFRRSRLGVRVGVLLLICLGNIARPAIAQDPLIQFDQLRLAARYKEAEALSRSQLDHYQRNAAHDLGSNLRWSSNLGLVHFDLGRFDEAEPLLKRALELAEKLYPAGHVYVTDYMIGLADLHTERNRFELAEPLYREALSRRRAGQLMDPALQAANLRNAAAVLRSQGQTQLADDLDKVMQSDIFKDASANRKVNAGEVAEALDHYGRLLSETGRYADAEKFFTEAMKLREEVWGPLQKDVATSLDNLGQLFLIQGQYAKSESRFKQALSIREQILGVNHTTTALSLSNMAMFQVRMGRLSDSEQLLKRAITIYERSNWQRHPDTASAIFGLATLYANRGRFSESESLFRQSLDIRKATYSEQHKSLAQVYDALANLHQQHGRVLEAEKLARDSLAIREKVLGKDHIEVALAASRLAGIMTKMNRSQDAETLYLRALVIRKAALGQRHADVARTLGELGLLRQSQGKLADGVDLLRESQEILTEHLGPVSDETLLATIRLAEVYFVQSKFDEALKLVDGVIERTSTASINPDTTSRVFALQSRLAWQANEPAKAIEALAKAIASAEEQRALASGSELEQGALFARYYELYQDMFAWQVEIGNLGGAFAIAEQARARSLVDQMGQQGADPFAGVRADLREAFRRKDSLAKMRAASFSRQLQLLQPKPGQSAEALAGQRQALITRLRAAQQQVLDNYRELRGISRTMQMAGSKAFRAADQQTVEAFVKDQGALLLYYFATRDALYRIVVTPDKGMQIDDVKLDAETAKELTLPEGRIGSSALQAMLKVDGRDLHQRLASPQQDPKAIQRLAVLWRILIPPAERDALTQEKYSLLIAIPDGPLMRLPLETLVVEAGESPVYFLDVGPPLLYTPSVNVMLQLTARPLPKPSSEPILTIGDPNYLEATSSTAGDARSSTLMGINPRTRFATIDAGLSRLPHTALESTWVAEVFQKAGTSVIKLLQAQATEAACRLKLPGREVVHLACHGLCDQESGNLFGALAFTPGSQAFPDPGNDGFLTLSEIYELDLSACELAILSACETNAGPLERGEGVWALSRGFLVAGSRRVVASNWLVDDEAGASLISYFCAALAQDRKGESKIPYFKRLHLAKRWIRKQEAWSSPYYWGTFVLVGAP